MQIAYDDIISYIHSYTMDCIKRNKSEEFQIIYDSIMPASAYLIQFWLWDKWVIITNLEARENIKRYIENKERE